METATEISPPALAAPSRAEFEAMIEECFEEQVPKEGTVVEGRVIAIENNQAIIDVGFKTEGRVDLREFARPGRAFDPTNIQVGDKVNVFLDRIENARGEAVLSREKANREVAWDNLEAANADDVPVEGVIFGRVKGGFSVDLGGAVAFLPGSQIDMRPMSDASALMDQPLKFQIVKMDRRRGNVVVSRRAVLEKTTSIERARVIEQLNRGDIVEGPVKNIVDFGAFVDLGGIDGLLHVTDMAWRRIHHPSEIISVGDVVRVQVVKVNRDAQRISLGMKQLEPDPWEGIVAKYPPNMRIMGRVANITEFGAFVELEPGVEGLIHVSEMSWTKKNVHPGKIISTSQEVEVMVLNTDPEKRRISLGLKQCRANPWEEFAENHKVGSVVEGPIRSITEFGIFIGLEDGIDGMAHHSDLSWEKEGEEAIKDQKKGEIAKAVVLAVDIENERVSLGVKQLQADPFAEAITGLRKGSVVSGVVSRVEESGIEVDVSGVKSFIRRQDLSSDRAGQRPNRFAVDERLEAQVTNVSLDSKTLHLSIKALEVTREKEAVRQYGSASAGAVLGEILAPALRRREEEEETGAEAADDGEDPAEAQVSESGGETVAAAAAGGEDPVEEAQASEDSGETAADSDEDLVEEAQASADGGEDPVEEAQASEDGGETAADRDEDSVEMQDPEGGEAAADLDTDGDQT